MNEILKPKYKYYEEYESLERAKLGQILWAGRNYNKRNKTSHVFVVVDNDVNEGYIYGTMLSSSREYDYILMNDLHFKDAHASGEKYDYPVRETLFVPKKLVKFEEWAPFYLVGELTDDGLEIIKNVIDSMAPEIWKWNINKEAEKLIAKIK